MMKKSVLLAATLAAMSFAGQTKADYILTLSNLTPTTFAGGGTSFSFAIPQSPQPGFGTLTQPFNVINVAEPTGSANGTGSTTLSVDFNILGTAGTPGNVSGTLTGTFTIIGATSAFNGSITGLTGTGFTISQISYTQPSVGSTPLGPTSGNISFVVTPTAVPEPASVAMVGLGLAGLGGLALRRRSAK